MKRFLLMIPLALLLNYSEVQAEEIAGIGTSLFNYYETAEDNPIDRHIEFYSCFYDTNSNLIRAIISKESEGDIQAYNRNKNGTHDSGLMQINSCNHNWLQEELGVTDFYDIRQNIQCGTYMVSLLTHKYNNVHKILMSYNMGEGRMRSLWKQGIYSSRYSREVVMRLNQIKEDK